MTAHPTIRLSRPRDLYGLDGAAGQFAGVEAEREGVLRERPVVEVGLAAAADVERDAVPAGEQVAAGVEDLGVEAEHRREGCLAAVLAVDERAQVLALAGQAGEVARDEQAGEPPERRRVVGAARPDLRVGE